MVYECDNHVIDIQASASALYEAEMAKEASKFNVNKYKCVNSYYSCCILFAIMSKWM